MAQDFLVQLELSTFFRAKFQSGEVLIDSQLDTKILRKAVGSLKPVGLFIPPALDTNRQESRQDGKTLTPEMPSR